MRRAAEILAFLTLTLAFARLAYPRLRLVARG